jgi:hypothetical protein
MRKKALSTDLAAAYRATEYWVSAQVPFTRNVARHSQTLAKLFAIPGKTAPAS